MNKSLLIEQQKDRSLLIVWIFVVSLLASIFSTFISYPGFLYTDSYSRWDMVDSIIQGVPQGTTTLSVVPQLFMSMCYATTNNYAFYTLAQSFLLFFSIFMIFMKLGLSRKRHFIVPLFFLLFFPLFPIYSVFHAPSIGFLVALNLVFLSLSIDVTSKDCFSRVCHYLILVVVFIAMIGYRQNAITIIPVIFAAACVYSSKYKDRLGVVVCMVLALCFISMLPFFWGFKKTSNFNPGLVWEMVSVIENLETDEYDNYLDYLGNTANAVEQNLPTSIHGAISDGAVLNPELVRMPENSQRIIKDYLGLMVKCPATFIKTKFQFYGMIFGVTKPLLNLEINENRLDILEEYGYRPTPLRHKFYNRYMKFMENFSIIRRPYIWFLLTGAMIYFYRKITSTTFKQEPLRFISFIYMTSIFYYGGFMLNAQCHEFRYFFPSFTLLLIVILFLTVKFLSLLFEYASSRLPIVSCIDRSYNLKWENGASILVVGLMVGVLVYCFVMPERIALNIIYSGVQSRDELQIVVSYDPERRILVYDKTHPIINNNKEYFLHLYIIPPDGMGYWENHDNLVNLGRSAVIIPDKNIAKIVTGQFDENGRIWEKITINPSCIKFDSPYRNVAFAGISKSNYQGLIVSYNSITRSISYNNNHPEMRPNAKFFLHVIPVYKEDIPGFDRGAGFDNYDFYVGDESGFVRQVPDYAIKKIVTGQFDENGRVWEEVIWPISVATPLNITNSEWENGISRKEGGYKRDNIVLFKNDVYNAKALQGAFELCFANGRSQRIEFIETDKDYIRVFLDGESIDASMGYPEPVTVLYGLPVSENVDEIM